MFPVQTKRTCFTGVQPSGAPGFARVKSNHFKSIKGRRRDPRLNLKNEFPAEAGFGSGGKSRARASDHYPPTLLKRSADDEGYGSAVPELLFTNEISELLIDPLTVTS